MSRDANGGGPESVRCGRDLDRLTGRCPVHGGMTFGLEGEWKCRMPVENAHSRGPRKEYHGDVRAVEHFALHLAKYAGELAAACEKLGHAAEREEGKRLLEAWLARRPDQVRRTLALIAEVAPDA